MGIDKDDLLRQAGYRDGDYMWLLDSGGIASNTSISTDTYIPIENVNVKTTLPLAPVVPPDATLAGLILAARLKPSTDQIDVRLQNINDGDTLIEETGITNTTDEFSAGPSTFTVTDRTGVDLRYQVRNSDNSTSITVTDARFLIGVEL